MLDRSRLEPSTLDHLTFDYLARLYYKLRRARDYCDGRAAAALAEAKAKTAVESCASKFGGQRPPLQPDYSECFAYFDAANLLHGWASDLRLKMALFYRIND